MEKPTEKPTEELLSQLMQAKNLDNFLQDIPAPPPTFAAYLSQLRTQSGKTKSHIIQAAQLNTTYGYQIFSGDRPAPGRNKVICLALALSCTLIQTNRLLKISGHNELYVKNRRDAIVIFAIIHGQNLSTTQEKLYALGEQTLTDPAG